MIAFALFLPDDLAKKIKLYDMREPVVPFLWLALVFFASIVIANLGTKVSAALISKRKASAAKTKSRELFLTRLRSLSPDETMWIQYCLYMKQQTLAAHLNHAVANMLAQKLIVVRGAGNVDAMPFTIRDDVWEILLEHEPEFGVPQDEHDSNSFRESVQLFEKNLARHWLA